jgi:hypothetical protein
MVSMVSVWEKRAKCSCRSAVYHIRQYTRLINPVIDDFNIFHWIAVLCQISSQES